MTDQSVQLRLNGISKTFRHKQQETRVLDRLSFEIRERDFVSIIGPSGCGKTTVFNIIAGLIDPDEGTLVYRDQEIESLRGRVGYMMQKDLLFPWRTVIQNVTLGLETKGISARHSREKARDYLNTFGLSGFENAFPSTLSGGMRQRVALIRTLVLDPDILLLDEPFSALDYQTRLHLEGVLIDAVEKFNKTVILVTHDIDEAVALSKRVVVLTNRPARAKSIHEIVLEDHSPIAARSDPKFPAYFQKLCAELDIQTKKSA